jgi:hypothetical protein
LWFEPTFDLALLTPRTNEELDALVEILMPSPIRIPNDVKDDLIRGVKRDGWVTERALASMIAGADLSDKAFPSLRMPRRIVRGKQDVLTPLMDVEPMHHVAPSPCWRSTMVAGTLQW